MTGYTLNAATCPAAGGRNRARPGGRSGAARAAQRPAQDHNSTSPRYAGQETAQ